MGPPRIDSIGCHMSLLAAYVQTYRECRPQILSATAMHLWLGWSKLVFTPHQLGVFLIKGYIVCGTRFDSIEFT